MVDWLIGDFLTEQYEGQRNLAGKISTLSKMNKSHGVLGEFLFDKKLLDWMYHFNLYEQNNKPYPNLWILHNVFFYNVIM